MSCGFSEVVSITICATAFSMKLRSSCTQASGHRNRLKRLSKVSSWAMWLGVGFLCSALSRCKKQRLEFPVQALARRKTHLSERHCEQRIDA